MAERMNNKQYGEMLMNKVRQWKAQGLSGEEAVSKLTSNQYDFLIDNDFDIESLWVEKGQHVITSASQIGTRQRRLSPNGYNKKYSQEKQDLYNKTVEFLKSLGAKLEQPEKVNFRDITLKLNGTKYKIVISQPRT